MPRLTFAEIDLNAIRENLRALRAHVSPRVAVAGIVKADAYGHGAVAVSRTLAAEGVELFAVALVEEGVALRDAAIPGRILLLGAAPEAQADEIAGLGFEAVLSEMPFAEALSRAACRRGCPIGVHLKFDTGMGRIGFDASRAEEIATRIARLPGLRIEGVMTHFAVSDEADGGEFTREQFAAFQRLRERTVAAGVRAPLWHCANSGAVLLHRETHLDMVRPGISLYGCYPSEAAVCDVPLREAMRLVTHIAQIRDVPAGATVSYGRTFCTLRPSRIAVLPVGYADGLARGHSNRGAMLVRGRRAPIAGRVCMDMTMLDVTDIPGAQPGDEVVIYGTQGGARISISEAARTVGTIPNDILCAVGRRVPRVYHDTGAPCRTAATDKH